MMSRASPLLLVLLVLLVMAAPAVAADEQAQPLEVLGAGGTFVQPLLHGGDAFAGASISLCIEPLAPPDKATGELLITGGEVRPGIAANLSTLTGERIAIGAAWIPGDIGLTVQYRLIRPSQPTALAPIDRLEKLDVMIAPGRHDTTIMAVYHKEW